MQVSQDLTFTGISLRTTFLVRGKWNGGARPVPNSLLPSKPSGSGGCALRGTIPGSVPAVRSRRTNTYYTE